MQHTRLTVTGLLIVFSLLFLKSTMELGLILPDLAGLVYETRNIIIGYLHFTLLGFISIFIIVQLQMTHIINSSHYVAKFGFIVFFAGFLWNEILLFYQGTMSWFSLPMLPAFNESLMGASILLLIGILLIWAAAKEKHHSFLA